ncbi:hypothetical protein ZWY2020_040002 [Hordeum vulgare]|nr:hypothetical protein ZWY2020_040002 [Hordeum vulgare]
MADAMALSNNSRPRRFICLLVLLLLLTVFARRSGATRPLRHPAAGGAGVGAAAAVKTIALPAAALSRDAEEAVPAEKRVEVLLGMKPRARAPPSGPSKRTNDIKS